MNKKLVSILVIITLISLFSWTFAPQNVSAGPSAAVPGLPFTEDFTDTALRDADETNANWSTEEDALILNWREAQYGVFDPGLTGADISSDTHITYSVGLGDVDGDSDLDLVAGNNGTNRLYLNNGTTDPFNGVAGSDISSDTHETHSVGLGDVDGDGDLDMLAGNYGQTNRLYLNNGTADPFSGVSGSDISSDAHNTYSVGLADVDGDGDLDLLAGNANETNRLYLNNGSTDPFGGVAGSNISSDTNQTTSIELADVDGDGDLDLVAGSYYQRNRLYLNNGTASPFSGASGTDISSDNHATISIGLADMDGDGDLDLLAGNANETNRLYLNNGTASPFSGVTGSDISSDMHNTWSIALGDVDGDGDLDMLAGNNGPANRLYLNNGSADPFSGVAGSDISSDTHTTYFIALGDMDGDGDLDALAGNNSVTNPNRLYLNEGTTNPFNGVAGLNISSDTDDTFSIALGDMDGDGDLDLVAGNWNLTNRLYLNNGSADPFSGVTGTDISSDTDDTFSIALGDVDGDGDLDMVAGNYAETNCLYLNNGTADPFSGVSGADISSDTDATRTIALEDVDTDGDLDLVAGNYGGMIPNRLYLNNGTATPFGGVSGSNISSDVHATLSIGLGDVDGDGDLDVLAGNYNQINRLYLNDGSADPFGGVTGADISGDTDNTYSIALGDVDGDGDLDLLAGNANETNRLYLNNDTASPFSGVSGADISSDVHSTLSIGLADVDKDGDLDLVAGNYDSETNRLYLNNGTASPFSGVSGSDISSDAEKTRSIVLGDVDGDGDLDMAAGNEGQTNRLVLNGRATNSGNGMTGSNISSDTDSTRSIALGDVDKDGDLDLVAGNHGINRLYLNNGSADPFSGVTGADISTDVNYSNSIALADMDGDGDLDLVAGDYGVANRLYLNNGTADPFSGVTGSNISSDAHETFSIGLGDVDGDGDLDLVVGNHNQTNRLYLNNGSAYPFSGVAGSEITSDVYATRAIGLADMDEDGDLDLVTGNYATRNRLYLNNGSADPFSGVSGADISSDTENTRTIALGDVDGDGDLDLVAGNYATRNRLYLNDGSADPFSGVSGSDISSDIYQTMSIGLGDVDGDGDLDLLAGTYSLSNPDRLYLNNGTASPFSAVTGSDVSSDAYNTYSIGLGDVDGNGDLDLAVGNAGQTNRLYLQRNSYDTTRKLARSLRVDTESSNIPNATLTANTDLPINTHVTYYLSNNGGARWYIVQSGVEFTFPSTGMDLRWKAELESGSPILTPRVNQIQIEIEEYYQIYLPLILR